MNGKDSRKSLSGAEIDRLGMRVIDGSASLAEGRKLIIEFINQGATGRIDPRLIAHVAMCFRAWLEGWNPERWRQPAQAVSSLDVAFGVAAPTRRGHPGIKEELRRRIAIDILERRLAGETLEQAVGAIADERQSLRREPRRKVPLASETELRRTWVECRLDALEHVVHSRSGKLGPSEINRLKLIFKSNGIVDYTVERYAPPEKSPD